ncbi:MAG: hypothetical protein ACHREM_14550 [Polyangiales bacterium]
MLLRSLDDAPADFGGVLSDSPARRDEAWARIAADKIVSNDGEREHDEAGPNVAPTTVPVRTLPSSSIGRGR